jgi:hypothetical protein
MSADALFLLLMWVALPLLPAVLIYWIFPDTKVSAQGPLASLTISASGAFAAYLIVFLITLPYVNTIKNNIGSGLHPSWGVRGVVKLYDGKNEVSSSDVFSNMRLGTQPETLAHTDGTLDLKVAEEPSFGLPRLVVDVPLWGRKEINLNKEFVEKDDFKKTINIGEHKIVRVTPNSAYSSSSPMDTGLPRK